MENATAGLCMPTSSSTERPVRPSGATETSLTVILVLHFRKQFLHVSFRVMPLTSGISGRINSGCTVQSLNLKACIIGETVKTIILIYILCLQCCITLQRICCFRDIGMAVYIIKAQNLYLIA